PASAGAHAGRALFSSPANGIELPVQPYRSGVMQGARNWGGAAPAVERWIVDLQLALTSEPADHIDLATDLGRRHLGPSGGHRRPSRPSTGNLRSGSAE